MKLMTDYYSILGLNYESNPGESEIKKGYRDQAKIHHPDKGGDPEYFKKVTEANEFLSEQENREVYYKHLKSGGSHESFLEQKKMSEQMGPDLGDIFGMFFGGGRPRNPVQPVVVQLNVSLKDIVSKEKKEIKYKRLSENGTEEEKTIRMTLENLEEQIILQGRGHQNNPKFKGDLVVILKLVNLNGYSLHGNNLVYAKEVNLLEALTKVNFEYNHLDGQKVPIEHIKAFKNDKIVIKGMGVSMRTSMIINGMPAYQRGDLIIKFEIAEPPKDVINELKKYFN
jgi:DnaJ-class molecular chaperone